MKYILFLLLLASCAKPTDEVKRILSQEGCTQIQDLGAKTFFTGCDKNDSYNNQFVCIKNNKRLEGVVCSGVFKGYTIRYY